jgi:hypothetical protein
MRADGAADARSLALTRLVKALEAPNAACLALAVLEAADGAARAVGLLIF